MSFVITGSVAYDYLMRYPGRFRDHFLPDQLDNISLSFLVDSMRRERGGVACNIAYNNKLLGGNPLIFATVGQDFGDYRRWLEQQGIDTTYIIEIADEFTASFFSNTDLDGKQIASFYSGAMLHARYHSLRDHGLETAGLVLISPNDPLAMVNYALECRQLGIPFALDPSQQVARLSGDDFRACIPGAAYLFCNEYELAIIQNKTGWSVDEIRSQVEMLIVTLAERGSSIYRAAESFLVPAAQPERVANPTGAGDAFRGGFFAALQAGLPLDVCGRVGSLCAVYAIESVGPTGYSFTRDEFASRYEINFGPEPQLGQLKAQENVS
jgi:adenosine kinase